MGDLHFVFVTLCIIAKVNCDRWGGGQLLFNLRDVISEQTPSILVESI